MNSDPGISRMAEAGSPAAGTVSRAGKRRPSTSKVSGVSRKSECMGSPRDGLGWEKIGAADRDARDNRNKTAGPFFMITILQDPG